MKWVTLRQGIGGSAGVIAAAAIFYANSLLNFPILYVSLAAAIVAMMVVRGLFGWQQRRLANQLFRQLPDTIELVTSTVRSGLPVNEAFRTIAREMPQPTAGQFALVCGELSMGRPPEEAVEDIYRRTQVAEYAKEAIERAGINVKTESIRGGTDGSNSVCFAADVPSATTLPARMFGTAIVASANIT